MSKAIRCINQKFVFKNSGISCLALIFNLSNPRTTILFEKNRFKVARYDESLLSHLRFSSIDRSI